ncbi:hypothetical protein LSAC_01410, partial [Levilinea saccharolytica]
MRSQETHPSPLIGGVDRQGLAGEIRQTAAQGEGCQHFH